MSSSFGKHCTEVTIYVFLPPELKRDFDLLELVSDDISDGRVDCVGNDVLQDVGDEAG